MARTVTVIAALAFAASAFLPWIDVGGQGANGFDVPMSFLWDEATAGGLDLGYLVVGIGGLGVLLSLAGKSALRRLVGGLGVATVGLFAAQLSKLLEGSGTSASDSFGTALYVGLVAAIVLASAPAPKSS